MQVMTGRCQDKHALPHRANGRRVRLLGSATTNFELHIQALSVFAAACFIVAVHAQSSAALLGCSMRRQQQPAACLPVVIACSMSGCVRVCVCAKQQASTLASCCAVLGARQASGAVYQQGLSAVCTRVHSAPIERVGNCLDLRGTLPAHSGYEHYTPTDAR